MEKQRNHNVHLTKRGRRVRAFIGSLLTLAVVYGLARTSDEAGSVSQDPRVAYTVESGDTVFNAILDVNGSKLTESQLGAAERVVERELGGTDHVYIGEQIYVPVINQNSNNSANHK
jgi:hypothetical protein